MLQNEIFITSVPRLSKFLSLPVALEENAIHAAESYAVRVTYHYAQRIPQNSPEHPLLLEILPQAAEENVSPYFTLDPLKEQAPVPGRGRILHKYHNRALLLASSDCFGNCRFCFRRHTVRKQEPELTSFSQGDIKPNSDTHFQNSLGANSFQPELDYLRQDTSIQEIILSGGDPLFLDDSQLFPLLDSLDEIPHLKCVRIHTRAPIFYPPRITDDLISHLRKMKKTLWMVLHINHPDELDLAVREKIKALNDAGVPLLQQGVLLRGVNDSVTTLKNLYETLIQLRVIPYYLHQLDHVTGAAHFEVPISRGRELICALRTLLPGYAVPRYVQEIPGELSKITLV